MSKKYRRVQTPKVALFLGAGASRAFDYPTTKEFLARLKPKLDSIQKNIVETFEESEKVVDIEHILQMLDALTDLNSHDLVKEFLMRHPPTYPMKHGGINWRKFITSCDSLKKLVFSELFTQYRFDEDKISDIVSNYERLFKNLATFNKRRHLDIFTTNYDSVVEEFYDNSETVNADLIDGFISVGKSRRLFWRPDKEFQRFFDSNANFKLRLFKLHGSLNWCVRNNGEIEKVVLEQQVDDSGRYKRNALIYPAQKTYEDEKPFNKLFEYFRDSGKTSKAFVVIGFSFRDDLINGIFLDHLRIHKARKLIVVSPNAKENVENNLLVGARDNKERNRFDKQVRRVEAKFGEEGTFERIDDALRKTKITVDVVLDDNL